MSRVGLAEVAWPRARLGEGIEALARQSGLHSRSLGILAPPPREGGASMSRYLAGAAQHLGLTVDEVDTPYPEAEKLVRGAGPAIVSLDSARAAALDQQGHHAAALAEGVYVLIVRSGRHHARLLAPDLSVRRVPVKVLRDALCAGVEAPALPSVNMLLERADVPPRRRVRARATLLRERLAAEHIGACYLLRQPVESGVAPQLRALRFLPRAVALFSAHAVEYGLLLVGWWLLGRGALGGHIDRGWLVACALLLATQLPFRALTLIVGGTLALDLGAWLKRRLLAGALRLDAALLRHEGAGRLLGRVIESQAIEALAGGAGIGAAIATLELLFAALVLLRGASGGALCLLLLGWVALTGVVGFRYYRRRCEWTTRRLGMTHAVVENMVGHRTRLAQGALRGLHDEEDQFLGRYLDHSAALDRSALALSLLPRGFLVVALAAMSPSFVVGGAAGTVGGASSAALAVALGGVLLGMRALQRLVLGAVGLAEAGAAWDQVAPLVQAARLPRPAALHAPTTAAGDSLLDVRQLSFRYPRRSAAVLEDLTLRICAGDRLLLEGRSGGGKSTLGGILAGLRAPESGLLLLGGLDFATLGIDGWRRRVVAAPQFHENHVLSETFAFNLLMGRAWPPSPADLDEAEALCRELDLGPLIDRMPAGLLQQVGETGWQISHGERSRLFIARALLQNAELVILDESFAALDPVTLRRALECVLRRSRTVMVIAHP